LYGNGARHELLFQKRWLPSSHLSYRVVSGRCLRAGSYRTSITPQAEGSHGGKHTLAAGSTVYHQDDIETGVSGAAGLRFHDNSDLKVGPKSRVKLDKFIYDPNRSAGSVAIEAAKGSFRFSTGSQTKGSYQVKTPYGTLGIRG